MTKAQRRLLAVAIGTALPLAVLTAVELLLRWLEPPALGVFVEVDWSGESMLSRERGIDTLAAEQKRLLDRIMFRAEKASPDVYRIALVGESTAAGFPFYPFFSVGRVLEELIRNETPNRPVRVINLGRTADSSEQVQDVVEALVETQVDLIVVTSGHNEFQVPYCLELQDRLWLKLRRELYALRLIQALRPQSDADVPTSRAPRPPAGRLVGDKPFLTDDERSAGAERFRSHLLSISKAAGLKVEVVFVTQASNWRDFPPSYSYFQNPRQSEIRDKYEQKLVALREGLESGAETKELRTYVQQLLRDDSTVALSHYYRGFLLERSSSEERAQLSFRKALDLDGYPNRATTPMNSVIREVAAATHRPLIDVNASFLELCQHSAPGRDLFLDHCHPTIDATFLMANTLFAGLRPVLREHRVLTAASLAVPPDFTDAEVVDRWLARFGLDREFLAARSLPAAELNLMAYLESPADPGPLGLAEQGFRYTLAAAPDNVRAQVGMTVVAILRGEVDRALDLARVVHSLDPGCFAVAIELSRTGTLRRALDEYGLVFAGGALKPREPSD